MKSRQPSIIETVPTPREVFSTDEVTTLQFCEEFFYYIVKETFYDRATWLEKNI